MPIHPPATSILNEMGLNFLVLNLRRVCTQLMNSLVTGTLHVAWSVIYVCATYRKGSAVLCCRNAVRLREKEQAQRSKAQVLAGPL